MIWANIPLLSIMYFSPCNSVINDTFPLNHYSHFATSFLSLRIFALRSCPQPVAEEFYQAWGDRDENDGEDDEREILFYEGEIAEEVA